MKLWYKDVQKGERTLKFRRLEISDEYRKVFAKNLIACMEFHDTITDADEHEIFQVCHSVFFATL